jgi:hypothetical protein
MSEEYITSSLFLSWNRPEGLHTEKLKDKEDKVDDDNDGELFVMVRIMMVVLMKKKNDLSCSCGNYNLLNCEIKR